MTDKESIVPGDTNSPKLDPSQVPALSGQGGAAPSARGGAAPSGPASEQQEATNDRPVEDADALYSQGMAHYRRREWKEAKACFARLKASAPDRRGVDALLNEVDIFIQLQAMQPEPQRAGGEAAQASRAPGTEATAARPTRAERKGRRNLFGPILVLVLALLMGLFLLLYSTGVVDRLLGSQRQARVQSLVNQGRAAMNVGDYDRAVKAFGDALALSPNSDDIKTWYEKALRNQKLATLYKRAEEDIQAGQWAAALEKLQEILQLDPAYSDVGKKIAFVKSQQALETQYSAAQSAYQQSNWSEAIKVLEQLRAQSLTFRTADVQQLLFFAYFREGVGLMNSAGESLDVTGQAIQSFDRALQIFPNDQPALDERSLANLYRQSLLFVTQKNWPQAVVTLQQINSSRPDYLGGRATSMLCSSYLQLGDAYYAAGNLEQALQQYRNVLGIESCDHVDAALKEREVYTILYPPTPTPTRTPVPTRTPRPTPTWTPVPVPTPTAKPVPQPTATKIRE